MLTMSSWPDMELDVLTELHLDPENVRLEIASRKVEADIMEDLFVNENALALVEGIAQIGYLSHEVPIVVKRRNKMVVVEGNRRVAALKAIQNPMLVPEFQARIAAATKAIPDKKALAKIWVKVAPNQDQANQLIAALHTTNTRRAWSPARQAAFFQAQIDVGRTYKELLARYPLIDVRKFVYRAHMVNLFKSVPYTDPELVDFLDSKPWKRGLSALARIFESREFFEITGLRMDEHGVLHKSISDSTLNEMAAAIVGGMLENNINTRTLNTVNSPRFQQLMTELRDIANPTPAGSGPKGKAKNNTGGSSKGGGSSTGGGSTGARTRTKRQTTLDVRHLVAPEGYSNAVKQHLNELSEINIRKFPNATFLLLRATLEKSIKSYAADLKIDIKATGNNVNGRVQLGHALKWLLEHVRKEGPSDLIQPIEKVRNGKWLYVASTDAMNAVNHNHKFSVEPDEVLSMYDSIDPILRHLMKL